MNDHHASIDASLLRQQRETHGWTMTDLAMRSCLSIKQIRQLEEGGSDAFYSDSVKLTAAKKVASVLGLSVEQVLSQASTSSARLDVNAEVQRTEPSLAEPVSQKALAELGQETTTVTQSPKSTHISMWVMAILFAVALLVAAWLNPSAEPVVTEAEPPLQVLPADDISLPASSVTGDAPQGRVVDAPAALSAASSTSVPATDAANAASR